MPHLDPTRIATRWFRKAGLLQPPPKLVEAVTEWVQGTFADRSRELAKAKRQTALKKLQQGEEQLGILGGLETLDKWDHALKHWKHIHAGPRGQVATTFDFTDYLAGWRYKHLWDNLSPAEQNELLKGPLRPFTVINNFDTDSGSANAGWSRSSKELHVWLVPDVWMPEIIPTLIEKHDVTIPSAIHHELQHVTQNAIGAMTHQEYGGLPKRKLQQERSFEDQIERQQHVRVGPGGLTDYFESDIEYHTAITNAVEDWNTKVYPEVKRWLDATNLPEKVKEQGVRTYARVFTYENQGKPQWPALPPDFQHPKWDAPKPKPHRFFENIKRNQGKWRNSVGIFYKEIAKTTKLGSVKAPA